MIFIVINPKADNFGNTTKFNELVLDYLNNNNKLINPDNVKERLSELTELDFELYSYTFEKISEYNSFKDGLEAVSINGFESYLCYEYNSHKPLNSGQIIEHMLSDIEAYRDDIKSMMLTSLTSNINKQIYWDAWFRGATGKALEDAEKGIVYDG